MLPSMYSDTVTYTATHKPIALANIGFFWKMIQVAMHKPRYVKNRVESSSWFTVFLSAKRNTVNIQKYTENKL